jgi:hypothetical protein
MGLTKASNRHPSFRLDAFLEHLNLPLDAASARSSQSVPLLDAVLKVEDAFDNIRLEFVAQLLELFVRDVRQLDVVLFRQSNRSTRDMVSLPERYLLFKRHNVRR